MHISVFNALTVGSTILLWSTLAAEQEFPRVYTTLVPDPSSCSSDQERQSSLEFVADLDLLEIVECNLQQNDDNEDGGNETKCKIVFLVHSEQELRVYSYTNTTTTTITMDRQRTMDMFPQPNETINTTPDPPPTRRRLFENVSTIPGYYYSCYPSLEGTIQVMDHLVQQAESIPSLNVTKVDIGDSYLKTLNQNQGHDIWALEITGLGANANYSDSHNATFDKPVVFVMAGIHPREYTPPVLLAHWAQQLVSQYGQDADITSLLDHSKIALVFQTNPDGRQLAESFQPGRRKNAHSKCGSSGGVDLNRNFPFRWGLDSGSSNNPCDQTYRGSAPASEPETQAIVNYAETLFPLGQRKADPIREIDAPYNETTTRGVFVDLHSYGNFLIWPWGHENKQTGNHASVEAMVHKISNINGYELSGPGFGFAFPASGATDDWAYGTLGAAGMTWELGTTFQQSCVHFEHYIVPDNLKALTYLANLAYAPYRLSQGPDIVDALVSIKRAAMRYPLSVRLQVTASDAAEYSSPSLQSSQQSIAEIRAYVDLHPHLPSSENDPPPFHFRLLLLEDDADEGVVTGTLTIALPILRRYFLNPHNGLHIIYFQAIDSDGYPGPVKAVWLEI